MKVKYYLLGAALVAMSASFVACSDNDEPAPAPTTPELTLPEDALRVKIGAESRVSLESVILDGAGEYTAYSLNPEVADIETDENGSRWIAGYQNGMTSIVIADAAGQYKRMPVSVYTTDVLALSHTEYKFLTPLGISASSSECKVELGNGGYKVESDNSKVVATINEETGVIKMTATSGKDNFVAVVTVSDCTGISATINVTVEATFDPFTEAEIAEFAQMTEDDLYIQASSFAEHKQYYIEYSSFYYSYGEWADKDNGDGSHTFGWWMYFYGSDYGGHYIIYPEGTALNTEVDATYKFLYDSWGYSVQNLAGKAMVVRDDEVAKVVLWWNVDMENECINRGWISHKK